MTGTAPKTADPVLRRALLATGLGAAFGIQGWRLAVYGFAMPWYGVGLAWLGHVLLGLCVGLTAKTARWWKRGVALGLAFGIAYSLGALLFGWFRGAYSIAAVTAAVVAAVLIALIADAVFPVVEPDAEFEPHPRRSRSSAGARIRSAVGQRLDREKRLLEELDQERTRRHESSFGKAAEERVVWGELLDLELQEIDERVEQIRRESGDSLRQPPRQP